MLYTLQDQSTLKAIFNIKDQDIPHLQPGHSVLVMVPALNGKTFDARIKTIIPSGDPNTHEFQVEAVIPGAGDLLPGMFATVKSNN
ncbi:MAG: HlyD family efflux transporter periplasmic adaptor subunit, partial [Gammaproteobacteria bacterium]|nr:HlyD family efflux transporter periplasmic adaptor subunit [Gammaproteobacteria bacterium]